MSLPEFRDALRQKGMSMGDMREQLRRRLTLQRLRRQEMRRRINVTDQEIDQYIQNNQGDSLEYNLSHILIASPEAASPDELEEARKRAKEVKAELDSGGNFASLASTWSDSRTALEGGDMGWLKRGELPRELAAEIADMDPGDVSPILRTPSGFHLYKLDDRRRSERKVVTEKRTQQILIKTNDVVTDEDARKRLRSLRQRLVSNDARFEELAQANSDDANSAGDGGDMGWVRPKSMPPNLGRVIERLEPGELSEPFRSRFGWHLVRVTDTRDKDVTEESLRQQAQQALRKRKREAELEPWLRQLREEAYIEYRLSS